MKFKLAIDSKITEKKSNFTTELLLLETKLETSGSIDQNNTHWAQEIETLIWLYKRMS